MKVVLFGAFLVFGALFTYKINSNSNYNRSISSINFKTSEENVSSSASAFIKEIHAVKSVEQMEKFIQHHLKNLEGHRLNDSLDQLDNDYKIMTSHLYAVNSLRGVGYRIQGIAELDKSKHYNRGIVSDMIIIKLQNLATHINTYYPAFGDVVFDWISIPRENQKKDFHFISDIQNFAMSDLYFDLQKTRQIIDSVEVSFANPVTLDGVLLTGSKNIMTPDKRFFNVYPHALEAIKSSLESQSHDLIVFSQYNRDDYLNYQYKQSASLFSIKSALSRNGRPKSEVTQNILKWDKLYTFRQINQPAPEGHDTWMLKAWDHAKAHIAKEALVVELMNQAKEVLSSEEAWQAIANPYLVSLYRKNPAGLLSKRAAIVNKDKVVLRSWMTGDMISINLPKFYTQPPKDLKVFLPTQFDTNAKKSFKYNGKDLVNYRYGMPNQWNVAEWSKYFPSVKNNSDIKTLTNVLNESSEAPVVGAIVNRFITVSK